MPDQYTPSYDDVRPIRDLITLEEAWTAKEVMDHSIHDLPAANAKRDLLELALKRATAGLYQTAQGTSQERRRLEVEGSLTFKLATEVYLRARQEAEERRLAFDVARIKVDLWRTIESSRRTKEAQEIDQRRWEERTQNRRPYQETENDRR